MKEIRYAQFKCTGELRFRTPRKCFTTKANKFIHLFLPRVKNSEVGYVPFFFHALKEFTLFTLNGFSLMLFPVLSPLFVICLFPSALYPVIIWSCLRLCFLKKMLATADKKHIFFYLLKTILILLLHKSNTAVTIWYNKCLAGDILSHSLHYSY